MVDLEGRIRLLRRAADRLEGLLSSGDYVSPSKRAEVLLEVRELRTVAELYIEMINK